MSVLIQGSNLSQGAGGASALWVHDGFELWFEVVERAARVACAAGVEGRRFMTRWRLGVGLPEQVRLVHWPLAGRSRCQCLVGG